MSDQENTALKSVGYTNNPKGSRITKSSLHETIFNELRGRLQAGEFSPDDRLLDYEIAEEFGCTRMPVRQAMLRLVNDGYLVATTRGFLIPHPTKQDLLDVLEIRQLLEPRAAGNALAAMTSDRLDLLNKAYRKAKRALGKDARSLIEAVLEFREVWVSAVGSRQLRETIEKFAGHAQYLRRKTLSDPHVQEIAVQGMLSLVNAYASGSAAEVEKTMSLWMQQAEAALLAYVEI